MHLYEGGSNRCFNTNVYPITDKYTSMNLNVSSSNKNMEIIARLYDLFSDILSAPWMEGERHLGTGNALPLPLIW